MSGKEQNQSNPRSRAQVEEEEEEEEEDPFTRTEFKSLADQERELAKRSEQEMHGAKDHELASMEQKLGIVNGKMSEKLRKEMEAVKPLLFFPQMGM